MLQKEQVLPHLLLEFNVRSNGKKDKKQSQLDYKVGPLPVINGLIVTSINASTQHAHRKANSTEFK